MIWHDDTSTPLDNPNEVDNEGCTVLMRESWKGNADVVTRLIREGADVMAKDYKKWTALHYAAQAGHSGVVSILVEKGGRELVMAGAEDDHGWTCLHLAAGYGRIHVAKELLLDRAWRKELQDITTKSGERALDWAKREGDTSMATLLTKYC